MHFQSTSLSRGKTAQYFDAFGYKSFQSTSLSRGKTWNQHKLSDTFLFQSTSLSRGKTPFIDTVAFYANLSIHFPLTREDSVAEKGSDENDSFNPLPSHEGRLPVSTPPQWSEPFNPLPSHEGRRGDRRKQCYIDNFQSTSLSRGKTWNTSAMRLTKNLSIHFPLTREDKEGSEKNMGDNLSIHFPLTREDPCTFSFCHRLYLSIHFPLTREDYISHPVMLLIPSFNPLPSHEGRRQSSVAWLRRFFLSIHFPLTREDH